MLKLAKPFQKLFLIAAMAVNNNRIGFDLLVIRGKLTIRWGIEVFVWLQPAPMRRSRVPIRTGSVRK
jgi:hypothetical protein